MSKIPNEFMSDETGEHFSNCVMCATDLMATRIPYAIEKAYKRLADGSLVTLFEMAICMPCGQKMNERMSTDSKKVMEQYFSEIHLMEKRMRLAQEDWKDKWNHSCIINGERIDSAQEFNLIGNFVADEPIQGLPPMAISTAVLEVLQEQLSPQTREELDDFRDTYLGPSDPELRALLSETHVVFV